ncbi:MAG: aminoacyl-tRNA hydrolase [Bdellovibrionales bacterium]
MKFIVGLGNPGPKYLFTRHNIGFMAIDHLIQNTNSIVKEKWQSQFSKTSLASDSVILQKPMTFMNLSGSSVQPGLQFFKCDFKTDLIVIQDDIAMPFGAIRLQQNRSAGGHNGIKDITQRLGSQDYARLKVGVGMPSSGPVDRYVLSDFSKDEQKEIPFLLNDIEQAVESFIKYGVDKAANLHNRKGLP